MISVGKFAQMCRVSVKTLRYYDQIGLLHPAYVDENSGFRYYQIDQLDDMVAISRYKRFGFSLSQIASLNLHDPGANREAIGRQKSILTSQLRHLQSALQELELELKQVERNGKLMNEQEKMIQVDLTTPEAMPALSHRETMSVDDFGRAFSHVMEQMHKLNLVPGINGTRYWDQEFDSANSDMEVFVLLPKDQNSQANTTIGGTLSAHAVHTGPYSTLDKTYAAITKWIYQNGYEIHGAPYELYTLNGYQNPDPAAWQTDIFFPVAKATPAKPE